MRGRVALGLFGVGILVAVAAAACGTSERAVFGDGSDSGLGGSEAGAGGNDGSLFGPGDTSARLRAPGSSATRSSAKAAGTPP